MRANEELLNTLNIQRINDALQVMKHFIELSNKLLPILFKLQSKEEQSLEDQLNVNRIIDVYQSHQFDPISSDVLMNSPVLSLIRDSFDSIRDKQASEKERCKTLSSFQKEYERLREAWNRADMN